ncbi:MAG: CDGSH iron-sulfur domain-containing protein [Paludibacteraceae bacterium]|nr:CDGSH iron-sulfur domain-containing protein [Paludibacteraceae bacterium]MBN2787819.1 CDGSH iron-sulfur domain-containing protein [Paludibacteraceae bacterium]
MDEPKIAGKSPKIMKMEAGTYYWCACGRSSEQPFCDGSHVDTDIVPEKVVLKEPKTVAWCMCKQSKNKPFCDGSHSKL